MPLDPLVKAFLDQAAAIPRPKAWEMPLGAMRKSFAGMMGLVGPKDVPVGKIENFKIPAPQGDIRARAYAPVAVGGAAMPALVYFHGGGFVVGDLDTHDGLCRLLAHEGAFVIAVEHPGAKDKCTPAHGRCRRRADLIFINRPLTHGASSTRNVIKYRRRSG